MQYTAKGMNASNMLVNLKAQAIQIQSHCEKKILLGLHINDQEGNALK